MPRNHNLTTAPRCEAIRYAGHLQGKHQRRGTVCAETSNVVDGLCWTHRKTVELGRATHEQVLKGLR